MTTIQVCIIGLNSLNLTLTAITLYLLHKNSKRS